MVASSLTSTTADIIYPDRDGNPMSDNTKQFRWIVTIKENLELLYAEDANVFVAGDLLWYPVEGSNTIRQAPDAMVVFGRPKGDRGSYQQWKEERIAPQVVFEILSPGNRLGEMNRKLSFYDRYGVEEYYIYDPDRIDFAGWIRTEGRLAAISSADGSANEETERWVSPRLGIRFELQPDTLQIYRPDGQPFLSFVELDLRRQAAEQRAEDAEQRAENAQQRAEDAEQRVEVERDRAENAEQLARLAQEREARLAAKLRELGIDSSQI